MIRQPVLQSVPLCKGDAEGSAAGLHPDDNPVLLAAYRAWPDAEDIADDAVGIIEELARERDAARHQIWLLGRSIDRVEQTADIVDATTTMMMVGSGAWEKAKAKAEGLRGAATMMRPVYERAREAIGYTDTPPKGHTGNTADPRGASHPQPTGDTADQAAASPHPAIREDQ